MKYISILGSTGSIGKQTLEVVRNNHDSFKVCGLSGNSNIDLLEAQVKEFRPRLVAINDDSYYTELKSRIGHIAEVVSGLEGMIQIAAMDGSDYVMSSIVGIAGLIPTYHAVKKGKAIGLANKETLVTAGRLVMDAAKRFNSCIIPVDSEHSAIFQCISGNKNNSISRIILTASGGPFRNKSKDELHKATIAETLKHPRWSMGRKISVDSATLMNKGLEVIEAKWLFNVKPDLIEVCVHPESVIHSMVEFNDGSVIAQLGVPDMRVPIQYSLTYPDRKCTYTAKLDLFEIGKLNFEKPRMDDFKCLSLAYNALKMGDSSCIVLNSANEVAVDLFLAGRIGFLEISELVECTLESHSIIEVKNIENVIEVDSWARVRCREIYKERCKG